MPKNEYFKSHIESILAKEALYGKTKPTKSHFCVHMGCLTVTYHCVTRGVHVMCGTCSTYS